MPKDISAWDEYLRSIGRKENTELIFPIDPEFPVFPNAEEVPWVMIPLLAAAHAGCHKIRPSNESVSFEVELQPGEVFYTKISNPITDTYGLQAVDHAISFWKQQEKAYRDMYERGENEGDSIRAARFAGEHRKRLQKIESAIADEIRRRKK